MSIPTAMWSDAEGTRASDRSLGAQTIISPRSRSVATAYQRTASFSTRDISPLVRLPANDTFTAAAAVMNGTR